MIRFYLYGLVLLLSPSVWAAEWSAVQGDIVSVTVVSEPPLKAVRCFGKNWPMKQLKPQHWQAWIGVDLKRKPGDYPLIWQGEHSELHDVLHVKAGQFRISRIQVPKKMSNFDAEAIRRIRADQAAIKATYAMKLPFQADFSHIYMPVQGIESTPFGAQRFVNGQPRSPHSGIDIAAPKGTPVLAPMAGEVLLEESMFLNGNLLVLGHGSGLVSVYAHLSHFDVKVGDKVAAGQKIAEVGSTGRSTGAHLHWGVRFQYARVNPHALLSLAKAPVKEAE